jgi:hypothetical protein
VSHLSSPALNEPVDLGSRNHGDVRPELASKTTLNVQADFYVTNQWRHMIVHMRQGGTRGNSAPDSDARRTAAWSSATERDRRFPRIRQDLGDPERPRARLGYAKGAVMELPSF